MSENENNPLWEHFRRKVIEPTLATTKNLVERAQLKKLFQNPMERTKGDQKNDLTRAQELALNSGEFEPLHTQKAPYWQDIVFGEGRIEALIERLEAANIDPVNNFTQKETLQVSEGGSKVLPKHQELVKYGLNDSRILRIAELVKGVVIRMADDCPQSTLILNDKTMDFMRQNDASQTVARNKILEEVCECFSYVHRDDALACLREEKYTSGVGSPYFSDDRNKKDISKIIEVVYAWLMLDVAPAVPNILHPGLYCKTDDQGQTTLHATYGSKSYIERRLKTGSDAPSIDEFTEDQKWGNAPIYEVFSQKDVFGFTAESIQAQPDDRPKRNHRSHLKRSSAFYWQRVLVFYRLLPISSGATCLVHQA